MEKVRVQMIFEADFDLDDWKSGGIKTVQELLMWFENNKGDAIKQFDMANCSIEFAALV